MINHGSLLSTAVWEWDFPYVKPVEQGTVYSIYCRTSYSCLTFRRGEGVGLMVVGEKREADDHIHSTYIHGVWHNSHNCIV